MQSQESLEVEDEGKIFGQGDASKARKETTVRTMSSRLNLTLLTLKMEEEAKI